MTQTLNDLPTPSLVLDRTKLEQNTKRMSAHINALGVDLRPHVKTSKSAEVARLASAAHSGAITVSTLEEARYFADADFKDILYAVGIVPSKLAEVAALQDKDVDIKVVLDDLANAREVAKWAADNGRVIPVLIEIDSDGHRAGL
ncbi:MAG: alanine racemase, partial [Sphingomonadales bacterium]|nr:alanine racemase [Sphingomonadales bacterium]